MRRFPICLVLLLSVIFSRIGNTGEFNLDPMPFGLGSSGPNQDFPGFTTQEKTLLTARLIPEFERGTPGQPLRLILEMTHLSGSYTYWAPNPGGPGKGSRLIWTTLPDGWTVSNPVWPAPQKYTNGGMTFYVHKNKSFAFVTVTPPPDAPIGDTATLEALLDTQVCTPQSCTPLKISLQTTLSVGDNPGEANPLREKALGELPIPPRGWRFETVEYGEELVVGMYPEPGSNMELDGVYLFDSTTPKLIVDSQQPQVLTKEGGVWWLRVPLLEGASRIGGTLRGVIHSDTGWLEEDATSTAMTIESPLLQEGTGKPAGIQAPIRRDTALLLFFAFLGGLLLNVMPCVFPVIGLKIMGFAKQAHKDRRAVFLHGLAYMAGVLLCFWTLSFLVITMGRGWGAQLQSEWFMFALCHIFMMMSMNMAGVFEVGTSAAAAGQAAAGREGIKRSFLTGLLATITSTPCSAPFLGTALAYALSLPALLSLGVFTLMGFGFAFPYLALSLFPGWLKKLPKPGPWMDTFRQAMCFPLFATTAYLFWTMEAMLAEWHFLMLLFGLVMTAMACWLYGKSQKSQLKSPRGGKTLFICALIALAGGLWLGYPRAPGELRWEAWSPETVSRLRDEGRAVYVDFTARWCATCQLNKHVYQDDELVALLQEKNVALLKADWTSYDDRITSTLRTEFDKAAVPVTVLYVPGQRNGQLLPDILTVGNVTDALQSLP